MLSLSRHQVTQLISHAREASPSECCGLIGGSEDNSAKSIYRLLNVAAEPEIAYEAAPEELFAAQRQMRERDEKLLAVYHSHPRSIAPKPSQTDVRLAYYPAATYLIIGLGGSEPVMRGFRISEREQFWEQVEYTIVDE